MPPLVPEVLVVMDLSKDARFRLNGVVKGPPHFRFYAGAPLVSSVGLRLGSLCLSDTSPRFFTRVRAGVRQVGRSGRSGEGWQAC